MSQFECVDAHQHVGGFANAIGAWEPYDPTNRQKEPQLADDALAAVYAHMEAINSREADRVRATHNYPFLHLWPDGRTSSVQGPDVEPGVSGDVSVLGAEWHHSTIDAAEKIIRGLDVVSFRVEFSRHRADDSNLGNYEAIWIVTREQGHWGIKFRNGAFPLDR